MEAAEQQRLADEVAAALGVAADQVLQDAVVLARRLEAYRMPADAAREISDLQARVDLAIAQFRAGDLQAAAAQADVVLDRLRARPGLPMASSLAWKLHVLRGRIAWTQADDDATEAAWRDAVAVDPGAELSSREVPPDVIASYEAVRQALLGDRSTWTTPTFEGASVQGAQIEIDGVGGLRPVPQGEHFVVVHWPGAAPAAAVFDAGPVILQPAEVLVPEGLPRTPEHAELLCTALALDVLVLARMRGGRLGVQAYACGGGGFGDPWYSTGPADDRGFSAITEAGWDPGEYDGDRSVLLDAAPWPQPDPMGPKLPEPIVRGPSDAADPELSDPRKPWYRRAWVWVVAGAVVGGAVTTGVVLGTRQRPSSVVVTDDFLRP